MKKSSFALIDDGVLCEVPAVVKDNSVRLAAADVFAKLGWELKSQGLCKESVCVPVASPTTLQDDDGIDLCRLAEVLDRPLAVDIEECTAYMGVAARDRAAALASLRAPDFTLPDLDGKEHTLSDYRGRKVLLVAYASW